MQNIMFVTFKGQRYAFEVPQSGMWAGMPVLRAADGRVRWVHNGNWARVAGFVIES